MLEKRFVIYVMSGLPPRFSLSLPSRDVSRSLSIQPCLPRSLIRSANKPMLGLLGPALENMNDDDLLTAYLEVRNYYGLNKEETLNKPQDEDYDHPLFSVKRQLKFGSSCAYFGDDSKCTCAEPSSAYSISDLLSPLSCASSTQPPMSDIASPISFECADSPSSAGSAGSEKRTYGPYDLGSVSMCQVINPSSINGWKSAEGQFHRIYLGMNSLDIIFSDIMFYLQQDGGKRAIFDYIGVLNERIASSDRFVQLLTLPIEIQIVGERIIIAYIHCFLENHNSFANGDMSISITFDPVGSPEQDDQHSIRKHMREYFGYSLAENNGNSHLFLCNVSHTRQYLEWMARKKLPSNEVIQAILLQRCKISYMADNILNYLLQFSQVCLGKAVLDIGFTDEIMGIQELGPFNVITGAGICCYASKWPTVASKNEISDNLCESSSNLTSYSSETTNSSQ